MTLPGREASIAGAPTVGAFTPADFAASQDAAFGRAKDQTGLEARGALTGLAGAMAGRGISGSGVQGRGQLGVVNQGQQQLGDVSRQQAITAADLAEKAAETNYQGTLTMRGQDIGQNVAQAGLNVSQRGQDIGAQEGIQNSLVAQRGQDIGLQAAQQQGLLTQRGQDISQQDSASARALQSLIAQQQGGITQRGQDMSAQQSQAQLAFEKQKQLQGLYSAGAVY